MSARNFLITQLGPNGAVSLPTYGFSSSASGAGLYATGTDAIALATTGIARLSINSTGQVTIAGNVAFNGATPTTPPEYRPFRPGVINGETGALFFPPMDDGGTSWGLKLPTGTPKLTFGLSRQIGDYMVTNTQMLASVLTTLIEDLQAIGLLS